MRNTSASLMILQISHLIVVIAPMTFPLSVTDVSSLDTSGLALMSLSTSWMVSSGADISTRSLTPCSANGTRFMTLIAVDGYFDDISLIQCCGMLSAITASIIDDNLPKNPLLVPRS